MLPSVGVQLNYGSQAYTDHPVDMIPLSDSQQKRRQHKSDSIKKEGARTGSIMRSKLKVKLPGIAEKLAKIPGIVKKTPKKQRKSKRCEVLGKVPTKIAGYTYKHKKTGKNVAVKSYTRNVLKCLDK